VRALFTAFVVATIFIGTIVSTAEPMVTGVNAITLTNTIESRYVRHESGHAQLASGLSGSLIWPVTSQLWLPVLVDRS